MPATNPELGSWGEGLAADFLERRGYEILERNFRCPGGEIDLIARRGDTLHFVEVKTRKLASVGTFGLPQEAVNRVKRQRIIRTALAYLAAEKDENKSWQMDVITVVYSVRPRRTKLTFIEDAFAGEDYFD